MADERYTFDASTIWEVPPGIDAITIEAFGGGGGGGGAGGDPLPWGGGGGSGGDYNVVTLTVKEGQLIRIHIGEGGAGGAPGERGKDGGETWVIDRDTLRAAGGSGGGPGNNDDGPGFTLSGPHDNFPLDAPIWGGLGGPAAFEANDSGGGGGGSSGDESGLPGDGQLGAPDGTGDSNPPGGSGGHGGLGGYWNGRMPTPGVRPGGGGGGGGNQLIGSTSPVLAALDLSYTFTATLGAGDPPEGGTPWAPEWVIFDNLAQVGTCHPPAVSTSVGFALKSGPHRQGDLTTDVYLRALDGSGWVPWFAAKTPYVEGMTIRTDRQPCKLMITYEGIGESLVAGSPWVFSGDYEVTDSLGHVSARVAFRFSASFVIEPGA